MPFASLQQTSPSKYTHVHESLEGKWVLVAGRGDDSIRLKTEIVELIIKCTNYQLYDILRLVLSPEEHKIQIIKSLNDVIAHAEGRSSLDEQIYLLAKFHKSTRQFQIEQATDALNIYLTGKNPATFEEKKTIVEVINKKILDPLELAIHRTETERPCNLLVAAGAANKRGRFSIVPRGSTRAVIQRNNLIDILPIHLMGLGERREALSEWQARIREEKEAKAMSPKQPE